MINIYEVNETNSMIEHQKLDVRTITMGISLLDCCDSDIETVCGKIYSKITTKAKRVRYSDSQQKDLGNARLARRSGMLQNNGRFRPHRKDARQSRKNGRSQFHRRIFRACFKGNDARRRTSDEIDPRRAVADRPRLFLGQRRIDKDGNKHGRSQDNGTRHT